MSGESTTGISRVEGRERTASRKDRGSRVAEDYLGRKREAISRVGGKT